MFPGVVFVPAPGTAACWADGASWMTWSGTTSLTAEFDCSVDSSLGETVAETALITS